MEILLSRNHMPLSYLIRGVSWSEWSHCGVLLPDNTVVEAKPIYGVVRRPIEHFVHDSSHYVQLTVECPYDSRGHEFALAQVGKGYDYRGALGIAFHRIWDEDDVWWCSELLEAVIQKAGRQRFRDPSIVKRITPQHVYMVA